MGGTYTKVGDYYIPDLALPETEEYQIGKYGRMRRRYLKEHRPVLYAHYLTSCTLHEHLAEIDNPAISVWRSCAKLWHDWKV